PPLYPDGDLTDEPEEAMIAELVREAALEGVRDELPHSLAVQVEEMYPREGRSEDNPLWKVHVNLFVERPSQKAIIIGSGGSRLKAIGSESRRGIEGLLGTKVYLDLHVKVAKDWQRDPQQLGRLGFDFSWAGIRPAADRCDRGDGDSPSPAQTPICGREHPRGPCRTGCSCMP